MSGMFSTSREQEGSERAGLVPNNKGGDRRLPPLAPPVRALLASPEEVSYVEGVLARNWLPYEEVTARKPTSGIRTFHRPELPFKDIQRRMLDRALNRLAPHPLAFAYRQGASVVDCAMRRLARTIIRLDIADFFPNVRRSRHIFEALLRVNWPIGHASPFLGGAPIRWRF